MSDDLFRVRARYSVLVDHFAETSDRKAILFGLFEQVFAARNAQGALIVNVGWLVTQLEADIVAGAEHRVRLVLRNETGQEVHAAPEQTIRMDIAGEGLGLVFRAAMRLQLVALPSPGYFEWDTVVDGLSVAKCPMLVHERPPTP